MILCVADQKQLHSLALPNSGMNLKSESDTDKVCVDEVLLMSPGTLEAALD